MTITMFPGPATISTDSTAINTAGGTSPTLKIYTTPAKQP